MESISDGIAGLIVRIGEGRGERRAWVEREERRR
jgi:hypothetical protein